MLIIYTKLETLLNDLKIKVWVNFSCETAESRNWGRHIVGLEFMKYIDSLET